MNLFSSEKKFCPQKAHISEDNNYTTIIVIIKFGYKARFHWLKKRAL